jgi:hypothetical protein
VCHVLFVAALDEGHVIGQFVESLAQAGDVAVPEDPECCGDEAAADAVGDGVLNGQVFDDGLGGGQSDDLRVSGHCLIPEVGGLPGASVQDDRLFFGHFLHCGADAFLADAAALESSIGHEVGPPERGPVDVNISGVDLSHGLDRSGDIAGEDSRAPRP